MTRAEASKIVGWEKPAGKFEYPSISEVEAAVTEKNHVSLLRWNRFLPSPACSYQGIVLQKIMAGLKLMELEDTVQDLNQQEAT